VFTLALTPALSPGERVEFCPAFGRCVFIDSIQRKKFIRIVPGL